MPDRVKLVHGERFERLEFEQIRPGMDLHRLVINYPEQIGVVKSVELHPVGDRREGTPQVVYFEDGTRTTRRKERGRKLWIRGWMRDYQENSGG